jgi:hypothetical protein
MPNYKYFRYKKGRTEIVSNNDDSNRRAIRLAYINTFFYWLVRILITSAFIFKILSG